KDILITGATGTIGRRVVEGLVAKGAPVAALVRDAAKAAAMEAAGARSHVGTFEDGASLERAFATVDTVVLITPPSAGASEPATAATAAAKRAGARKIVRSSALKADPSGPTDNTRQHGRTDAALADCGLTYVILRPHYFQQNVLGSLATISAEGKIYW